MDCYPSSIVITTQAQLDFADDEPWCVKGHLLIGGNTIIDMHFDNLVSVGGNINVIYRRPPADWSIVFESLEYVGGTIKVGSNPRLRSIDLGENIEFIAGINAYGNGNLNSIKLGSLYGLQNIVIHDNNTLSALTSRDWSVAEEIEIYDNPVLPTCLISDLVSYVTYDTAGIERNYVDGCYPWTP
ncbi:MAG: hypothetical protein WC373_12825 [Smithella sp.]